MKVSTKLSLKGAEHYKQKGCDDMLNKEVMINEQRAH